MNPFAILGLPYGASQSDVKTAFRKLAHIHHPNKGGDAEKFKKISAAYTDAMKIAPAVAVAQRKTVETFEFGGVRVVVTSTTTGRMTNVGDLNDLLRKQQQNIDDLRKQAQDIINKHYAQRNPGI